jgi:hypothetical protein
MFTGAGRVPEGTPRVNERSIRMKGLPPGPCDGVLHQTVAFHRDPLAFLRTGRGVR